MKYLANKCRAAEVACVYFGVTNSFFQTSGIFFIYTQNGYVHVNVNSPGLGQGLGLAGRPVVAVNVNSY